MPFTLRKPTLSILLLLLAVQAFAHVFLLDISAHSGQVTIPWMMNQGMTLFEDVLEQHAPATSAIVAAAQCILPFDPITTARLLNLLLVLATTLFVYDLARLLLDTQTGLIAAGCWALWEPVYDNVLFYFDSLMGFLVLLAIWLWVRLGERRLAPFWVGVGLGLATVVKQYAWVVVVCFGLWIVLARPRKGRTKRDLALYMAGVSVFPLLTVGAVAAQGNFDNYLYWNWLFNFSIYSRQGRLLPDSDFLRKVMFTAALVPGFALLSLQHKRRRDLWGLVLLMEVACSATIYPRAGENHVMAPLPLLAVMSGAVLVVLLRERVHNISLKRWVEAARPADLILAGVLATLVLGWGLTTAAPYGRTPFTSETPAYDEFEVVAARLQELRAPGDTLFVLPETDSTPQLHMLTGMLPPSTWIKGWSWYLQAPDVVDDLLAEWANEPPDFIVVFPGMMEQARPAIDSLENFALDNYRQVARVDDVPLHGEARIYRFIPQ